MLQIVALVRVGDDDQPAAGGVNAANDRVAIAAVFYVHHAGAGVLSNAARVVCTAVVGDDNFTPQTLPLQEAQGVGNARTQGAFLVEAWQNNAEFDGVGHALFYYSVGTATAQA